MTSFAANIVLLPSDELADKAIAVSHQLQEYEALFELSGHGPFPHATLYMTQLRVEDTLKVQGILADLANNTPPFSMIATRYFQDMGYFDPDFEKTDRIARLQMDVIAAINPIRDGMREKDKARMLEATGLARANLAQYGYQGVGQLFRPHMTLTRFAHGRQIDTSALPDPKEFSGQFTKLGLFEMGDNGTCARKIAEFELKGIKKRGDRSSRSATPCVITRRAVGRPKQLGRCG